MREAMASGDVHTTGGGRRVRVAAALCGLLVALAAASVANLCLGSVAVALGEVLAALCAPDRAQTYSQVVWGIRLPRLVAAGMLGGALALSGLLLQTFFSNPIAGPYILGISSGAKLAVAAVMVAVVGAGGTVSSLALVLAAFVGSLASMLVVLLFSRRASSASMLIVVGVMVGYVCSAATDFLVTFASDANIVNLRSWSQGSFSGIGWRDVAVMGVVVAAGAAGSFALAKPMAAYQLGEQHARSVGVDVRAFRVALICLSSLLAACVTAFAGPVSFVGIAVPHIVKRLLGTSRPIVVVPAALLGGAIFCLACDLVARTAFAPTEVSISAVTALFGAPVVIAVLLGRRREVA